MQLTDFERPDDFIQWWVEKVDGKKRHDCFALTAALIQLNIAGIQSTGMVVREIRLPKLLQELADRATR